MTPLQKFLEETIVSMPDCSLCGGQEWVLLPVLSKPAIIRCEVADKPFGPFLTFECDICGKAHNLNLGRIAEKLGLDTQAAELEFKVLIEKTYGTRRE